MQEAKNLEGAGKGKHVVVGPPWNRKIVKSRIPRQANTTTETPATLVSGAAEIKNRVTESETRNQGTHGDHGPQEGN